MVDFDEFTEEQMDDLTQQVLELYTTISEEALSLNDPDIYAKVRKITNDDDYKKDSENYSDYKEVSIKLY